MGGKTVQGPGSILVAQDRDKTGTYMAMSPLVAIATA